MNQPWNEIKASSIAGVVLDCDLSNGNKIGGGTATDNTDAINAVLATASATNPIKLILDGPTLMAGLVIAADGYTWIEGIGWNSGIWTKTGANTDPLNNGIVLPFDPQTTPPARAGYAKLSNFQINGNRGNGTNGDSTSGDPRGIPSGGSPYLYCGINFCNLQGVHIENMYIYNAPAYSIRLNNCGDIFISGCTIYNPCATFTVNCDCIHIDGPAEDIRIIGNRMYNNNSDDAVALNAHEGYGGTLTRAVVADNTFLSTMTAMRVYGSSGTITAPVYQVIFSGNCGSVQNNVILFGVSITYNQDIAGQTVIASDNIFTVTGPYINVTGNLGELHLENCIWASPTAGNAFIMGTFAGSTISHLSVRGCSIYRNTVGNTTTTALLSATAALTVTRMTLDGFAIVNEAGQSYSAVSALLKMTNVTISSLYVASLDFTNFTSFADSYTNISNLHGAYQPESNLESVTSAYTALTTDRTILGDTTSAAFAITLPAKAYKGGKYTFKNISSGANALTITGTIDGSANPTLASLAKMTVEFDGTNYWTV